MLCVSHVDNGEKLTLAGTWKRQLGLARMPDLDGRREAAIYQTSPTR